MKSGYKTTEFWTSLAAGVLGVAVTLGMVSPDEASAMSSTVTTIAGTVLTALAAMGYSVSRGLSKKNVV